jgi:hypothetical protein
MAGNKFAQQTTLVGANNSYVANVDSDGHVQTDVNNSVAIDDSTPIDVNVVTSSDTEYSVAVATVTTTGNTQLVAAPGAGNKIHLHRFHVGQGASGVAATVAFRFGAAGTLLYTQELAAVAANVTVGYGRTVNVAGGSNEALNFNSDTASVDFDVTVEYTTETV